MFITKVIIHNYLRKKQKLNKCSSMNPLLLLLLLLNKQAQTQISWFYYLFNDCKRRQSKYRWNAHSLSRSTVLQLFNRAHIVIRYFFPCFFFNRKKNLHSSIKVLKRACYNKDQSCAFEITFRQWSRRY